MTHGICSMIFAASPYVFGYQVGMCVAVLPYSMCAIHGILKSCQRVRACSLIMQMEMVTIRNNIQPQHQKPSTCIFNRHPNVL